MVKFVFWKVKFCVLAILNQRSITYMMKRYASNEEGVGNKKEGASWLMGKFVSWKVKFSLLVFKPEPKLHHLCNQQ